jgi:hypothetical protein
MRLRRRLLFTALLTALLMLALLGLVLRVGRTATA